MAGRDKRFDDLEIQSSDAYLGVLRLDSLLAFHAWHGARHIAHIAAATTESAE